MKHDIQKHQGNEEVKLRGFYLSKEGIRTIIRIQYHYVWRILNKPSATIITLASVLSVGINANYWIKSSINSKLCQSKRKRSNSFKPFAITTQSSETIYR